MPPRYVLRDQTSINPNPIDEPDTFKPAIRQNKRDIYGETPKRAFVLVWAVSERQFNSPQLIPGFPSTSFVWLQAVRFRDSDWIKIWGKLETRNNYAI